MSSGMSKKRSAVARKKISDESKAFEGALVRKPRGKRYLLRLYVTGATPRSERAILNLRALCEEKLPGQYDLEIIDIYQHPEIASREQIVVAPTLVKTLPLPLRKLIGDLSDTQKVLVGLDVVRRGGSSGKTPGGSRGA